MTATLRFTILGCASSGGVPRIDGDWGKCDPANPKNRRRRCSLLVERIADGNVTRVLIDTGPDMREQLLSAKVPRLDGVVYTHAHADHIHGIDDLRALSLAERRRIDVYMDRETLARAEEAFAYCFKPIAQGYPPILEPHVVEPGEPVVIHGPGGPLRLSPFAQEHGRIMSLGWRVGPLAYSCDLNGLPQESLAFLEGLDVWIVDALRYRSHSSHLTVEEAVAWVQRMAPKRAILTNLHQDLDYEILKSDLPDGIEPAYDMLCLELVERVP
jgi:phosphoribosyl 1,2-cyclic phosphate phosphodiesterase